MQEELQETYKFPQIQQPGLFRMESLPAKEKTQEEKDAWEKNMTKSPVKPAYERQMSDFYDPDLDFETGLRLQKEYNFEPQPLNLGQI